MRPDDFKDTTGNNEAVEPVETRFEVDPRTHCPHTEEHLKDEQAEEHKFGRV